MSDKVIGGDCKLCGCRNHAPLTCEQWKAQVKNEMRGMYGSAFKARSTDKLYEPTALLDAVRAHRDNLMRMLDAAITERDALAAENERLRQALCRYGMHLPSCPRSAVPPGNASCRCGLHTILAVPLKEPTT